MLSQVSKFASEGGSGGLSALGLNVKAFAFQLIAFVIVLIILSKFVFPRIVGTLEARRQTLEKSLEQARETEEALRSAELKAEKLLQTARNQADEALSEAKDEAKDIVSKAENLATEQTQRMLKEAQSVLEREHEKLHDQLKSELGDLVLGATEKVLEQKLTAEQDAKLIDKTVKELAK